jgi:hypothetical protein
MEFLQTDFFNDINSIFENETFLESLLQQERNRRILAEGPFEANFKFITQINGTQLKCRENGKIWDRNIPCENCTEEECFQYLKELSNSQISKYVTSGSSSICKNPLNYNLLQMLCNWRKHVKNTFIIKKSLGSDNWEKHSICTSELTFLSRKTELGGILGVLSQTTKCVNSLPTLVSLMEKEEGVHNGVKCLSAGFTLLIAMYMDWDIYTEENKIIIERLLKKVRKNKMVGLKTYDGSPWYIMFKCVLERRRIPDKLKEIILSRAHLP